MLIIEYAKNPQWTSSERKAINLIVKFSQFDEEILFTATENDVAEHGKELFLRSKQGVFGPIQDPDLEKERTLTSAFVRMQRNSLLAQTDWTQALDIPESKRLLFAEYRQALRDVPQQPGFPENIAWPEPPTQ